MKLDFQATTTALSGLATCLLLGLAPTPAMAQQALQQAPGASACQDLASMSSGNIAITSELVPAGPSAGGGRGGGGFGGRGGNPEPLPAHCRVRLVLTPTDDSHINSELWLPAANWNGKFLAVGNGGFAGSIQGYGDMQIALRAGYATAGTDTGHTNADGAGAVFGYGHPEKIVDFAYRAVHETTVKSKQLIEAYYSAAPRYSYFKGCSTGGRQAAMSAQRYPLDFDGIIGGAMANRMIYMHTASVVREIQATRSPDERISADTAKMVNEAVMKACDVHKEGFLNNPRKCSVDFSTLGLTPGQLKTVQTYYGGLRNSKEELMFSGQALGNPLPAIEGFNPETGGPGYGWDTVRFWGFQDETFSWRNFDLDRDMPVMIDRVGFVNSVDPDLSEFKAHGGKLILYAGWADTAITPENTVYYYETVLEEMGRDQGNWMRLFMVPGMGHCGGGPGPNSFDTLSALDAWRSQGTAPAQMMGTNNQSGLTRPLCPYPQAAEYDGTGDLKEASNWACKAP